MDIRTFRAATLQEALEQVRETLGPDAAVLHTRQVKRSRMGLFSSRLIEVEASVEMPVAGRFATRAKSNSREKIAVPSASVATNSAGQPQSEAALGNQPTFGVAAQPHTHDSSSHDASEKHLEAQDSPPASPESQAQPGPNRETGEGNSARLPPAMYETLSEMLDAGVEPSEAKALLQTASKMLNWSN